MPRAHLPRSISAAVQAAVAAARAEWPDFAVEEATFLAYLQARLPEGEPLETAVPTLHLADLYCACACVHALPRALAAFEARYLAAASRSLVHIDDDPEFAAEVKQLLRHKVLLAAPGELPRIAEYAGRGPLHGWVRAALLRLALNYKRDRKRDRCTMAAPLHDASSILPDPELQFVKSEYRQLFKAALTAAFAALDQRARTILRLYVVDGLNIERIGIIYHVHRATVARWIAQTRQTLATETLRLLKTQAGFDSMELEAGVALIQSQIDLSLSRLLRDHGAESTLSS